MGGANPNIYPSIYPNALSAQVLSGNFYAPLQFATGNNGTAVSENPPAAKVNFPTTVNSPSRLFSYVNGTGPKTFTAQYPGGTGGNWNVSFADDVWDIERTGIVTGSPETDTWDSAGDIIAAINHTGTWVAAGQRYNIVICNSGGALETLQSPGSSVTLEGNSQVKANSCADFALLINSGGTTITIIGE